MDIVGFKIKFDWFDYVLIGACIGVSVGAYVGYNQGFLDAFNQLRSLPSLPYTNLTLP